MEEHDFLMADWRSVWSKIKDLKLQIQLKRRWLLGVSSSERKKFKTENLFEYRRPLPESLIREDDIFLDTVKSRVEEAFGIGWCSETEREAVSDGLELPGTRDIERVVLSRIDDLSTNGLCFLAKILTGNRIKFEKTQHKMKKIIRESLSVVCGSRKNNDDSLEKISRQITEFLNNPQNFRDSCVPFSTPQNLIRRAAAMEVLNELEHFPIQTLIAMRKKLKEVQETVPLLKPRRSGFIRKHLLEQVKKKGEKMLSKLGKEDKLPAPLAKAMAVAGLSLKLTHGFRYSATEFFKFSSETEVLQNEIMKAIWQLNTKVEMPVLESVKNLLDPKAKVSARSLRTAVRNMLTAYLFGCSDMDAIPESLFQILAIINKKSRSAPDANTLKKSIDKEIECVLNVSAHTKQVLLDLLPAADFDVDFADAYMEDLEESDDEHGSLDDDCGMDKIMWLNDDNFSQSSSLNEEGTRDSELLDSKPSTAANDANGICHTTTNEGLKCDELEAKVSSRMEIAEFSFDKETTCKNKYLAIQEACDETSMAAYSLIRRLMEEFGHKESHRLHHRRDCVNIEEDSPAVEQEHSPAVESDAMTMIRVTEELIPSFPRSGMERLRRLLGS